MVSTEQKALLEIIKVGATEVSLVSVAVFDADWKKLYDLACTQGMTSVAWHGLEVLYKNGVDECPQEVKLQWYGRDKQVQAENKKMFDKVAAFADAVAPMKLAVLKGADYARYWNNPLWREFGDLDCVVVDENLEFSGEKSKLLDEKATEIGCKVDDGGYKHSHIHYGDLMVENHYSFTDFAGAKENEELERELRTLFVQSSLTSVRRKIID